MACLCLGCSGSDDGGSGARGDESDSAGEGGGGGGEGGSGGGEASWEDVDPCTVLPAEALEEAGVTDTDGRHGRQLLASSTEACTWGERFVDPFYVEIGLWEPSELFRTDIMREVEVAGRPAYTLEDAGETSSCTLHVDNADHFLSVALEKSSDGPLACDVAATLASAGLGALE